MKKSNIHRHWLEKDWTSFKKQLYIEWLPNSDSDTKVYCDISVDFHKYDFITFDIRKLLESCNLP